MVYKIWIGSKGKSRSLYDKDDSYLVSSAIEEKLPHGEID